MPYYKNVTSISEIFTEYNVIKRKKPNFLPVAVFLHWMSVYQFAPSKSFLVA